MSHNHERGIMNNPVIKAVVLLVFLMLGFFVGQEVFAHGKKETNKNAKPESAVEFGISKHAGLHYVHGGFDVEYTKYEKYEAGVYTELNAIVNINSLWTFQVDTSRDDDPKRTKDLLSDDWFDAKKFPKAYAYVKWLPVNNADNVKIKLKIKGITKVINAKVRQNKLLFRIVLKDFNIDNSWKRIFAGNYADVKVRL